MTRGLRLYLRARSIPATIATMLGAAAALWAADRTVDDPFAREQLTLLAIVLATVAIAPGLSGADTDLDRMSGFAWPPRRALHLVLAGCVATGLVATALHLAAACDPSWLCGARCAAGTGQCADPAVTTAWLVRNGTGLVGLVGLGAVLAGAGRAPLLPLLWTAPVALPFVPDQPAHWVVLTWLMQPPGRTAATVTAVVLGIGGVLAYALCGPRPRRL